jgi:putative MATE family efflux protein
MTKLKTCFYDVSNLVRFPRNAPFKLLIDVKDPIDSADSQEKIFKVALPVSLEAVFQTSLGFIDQIIVGTLGATAVAAVGLCNSISFIVMLLYSAIGTGTGVLVAQAFGRNDLDDVSKVAALGLMTSGIFGLFTTVPLVLYPGAILKLVGAPHELAEAGSVYFQLFSASAPLIVMSAVTTATFRSLNDSTTPMIITMGAVGLNTLLGLFLVFGWGPFPKLGVVGAGLATLIAQVGRFLALIIALYWRKKGLKWHWPLPGTGIAKVLGPLLEITYPIALSESLWATSTFVYTIVLARLGIAALTSSQIVMTIENLFIVAASGLAPAAVASIGQALGDDSLEDAKKHANAALRLGLIAGLLFSVLLLGSSFLVPFIYPNVGKEVLHFTFWGIIIVACVQPAKVLNSILGNGILPSGGDTKYILLCHVGGSYGIGVPAAIFSGFVLHLSVWGVFGSRALEEVIKTIFLLMRYRTPAWYKKSVDELSRADAK